MRYAGFWRRLGAHIVDSLILNLAAWLGEFLLFGAMYGVYAVLAHRSGETLKPYADAFDPMMIQIADAGIYIALCIPYFVWAQVRYGATWGKRLLHIRVVNAADSAPMTYKQSAIRFVSYLPSYLTLGCGFFMAAFHPQKRALHDLLAGTVSVITEP